MKTTTIPTFSIQSVADVKQFFSWLAENDLLIHPDDAFTWIVDFAEDDGEEPCITMEQALYLDEVMDKCFEVCEENQEDVYELCPFDYQTR